MPTSSANRTRTDKKENSLLGTPLMYKGSHGLGLIIQWILQKKSVLAIVILTCCNPQHT